VRELFPTPSRVAGFGSRIKHYAAFSPVTACITRTASHGLRLGNPGNEPVFDPASNPASRSTESALADYYY